MSTTTLPNRLPNQLPAPPHYTFRQWGRTLASVLAAVGTGLWAAAVRVCIWIGRLVAWFAAEPGRVRAAFLGILTSAAIGSAVGVAAGVVVARIVRLLLGIVEEP
ncbi:hypothetical protein [Nocardioides pakistanensis]